LCKRIYFSKEKHIAISKDVLDELMRNYKRSDDITGPRGALEVAYEGFDRASDAG
jgi:hypothetical protein